MVYLAESRALAALEILAHVEDPLVLRDAAWIAMSLSFEESLLEKPGRFPEDWRATPAPRSTQLLGSRWVREARSPLMRVPSALVLGEFNYLLNPLHAAVKQIKVGSPEPFLFDARLAKQVLR
jgi:RES domain-containing protein